MGTGARRGVRRRLGVVLGCRGKWEEWIIGEGVGWEL